MTYWKTMLKWGVGTVLLLLVLCFIYGLFNRFSFIHGASPAGIDAALAYVTFIGFFLGPYVFLVGAIIGAVKVWWLKRRPTK